MDNYETITAQELDDVPKRPSASDDHWGYHLLIDMSGCNKNIDNHTKIRLFLKELVRKLDMKPIGDPIIVSVNNEEGRGTSAVQIITTSTITFHGDDEKSCVYLDVFSCAKYKPKIVFEMIKKYFSPKKIGYKWIYRDAGGYPKSSIIKAQTPSQLGFPVFLMNFPFSVDNKTPNNPLMSHQGKYNYDKAFSQFMDLYHYIAEHALVYIIPSVEGLQDQPFVANLGCYLPSVEKPTILLANFKSKPRVGEENPGHKFFSDMGYKVAQPPFTWEGEADLKYIRGSIYVGGYGIRTDIKSYKWMEENFDIRIIPVKMTDPKLYHFDCNFFPLGEQKALVATKVFSREDIKAIEGVVEIIPVPDKFIYHGWTNNILLGNKVLHTVASDDTHEEDFRKFILATGFEPVVFYLWEFEKSGADLSCMLMHLNYNNRSTSNLLKKSEDFWWAERISKLPKSIKSNMINILKSHNRVDWWTQRLTALFNKE